MRTFPTASELIEIVSTSLRSGVLDGAGFYKIVAANALDIAQREINLGADVDAGIVDRLQGLLGETGTAAQLESTLAQRMAVGAMDAETPGLMDHLWATVLAEMAIDQPKYATYRHALQDLDKGSS